MSVSNRSQTRRRMARNNAGSVPGNGTPAVPVTGPGRPAGTRRAMSTSAGIFLITVGIVVAAALPSLLMLWRYTTATGLTVFTELVDLTVVTVAIPYLFSACAQLTYLVSRRRPVQGWLLARDLS